MQMEMGQYENLWSFETIDTSGTAFSKNIVILKIKLTIKNAANTVFPETLFQQWKFSKLSILLDWFSSYNNNAAQKNEVFH